MNRLVIALAIASLSAVSLPGALLAAGEVECLATNSMIEQRWAQAERILRENRARATCRTERTLVYNLAFAVDQIAKASPARSCEARDLYDAALEALPDTAQGERRYAIVSRARAAAVCVCLPPGRAIEQARWGEAEIQLDARIADPGCESSRGSLELARAQVIEKQVGETPRRACEAEGLYTDLAETATGPAKREVDAGARRMGLICSTLVEDCSRAGDEDLDGLADCADPACRAAAVCAAPPPDDTALWLGVGAGATAALAGGLLVWAHVWDNARIDDQADWQAARRVGDAEAEAEAEAEFEHNARGTNIFGLSGLAALAAAAGLAIGALLYDGTDPAVTPMVGPGGAAVHIRF